MVDQSLLFYRDVRGSSRPLRLLGAPYATVDGINEKGLACAVLELMTKPTRQRTGKRPITTNVALRGILDTCASVDEAVDFLDRYDMHDVLGACYHYQITDAQGRGAAIEYVDGAMHVHRADRPDEPLQLTNHFITPGSRQRIKFGRSRYEHIECALRENMVMEEMEAMRLLSESTLLIKLKWTLFSTIWSAVYNCTDRTVLLSVMRDYTHQYRFSLDKPCEATPVAGFDAHLSDQPVEVGLFRQNDLEGL